MIIEDNRIKISGDNIKKSSTGFYLFSSEEVLIPAKDSRTINMKSSISIPSGNIGLICTNHDILPMGTMIATTMVRQVDELKIMMINYNDYNIIIQRKEKIANLIVIKTSELETVDKF
jgi:dUTPase